MQGVAVAQEHDTRATFRAVVADRHRLAVMIAAATLVEDVVGIACSTTEGRLDVRGHCTRELMHRGAAD